VTAVLGVDGGGSKTHAAICDENGTLIGAGTAGPSNWETVGLRGASDSIGDAIERAMDGTDLRRSELARPCSASPVSTGRRTCRGWRRRSRHSGWASLRPSERLLIALRAGCGRPGAWW
jgi:N-acetylglucosamine kinase-like BadF-type ATPase